MRDARLGVLDRFSLSGRTAVVAGATKNIGRGVAEALAEAGADVTVAGRDASAVEAVCAAIRDRGRRTFGYVGDLTDPAAMASLAEQAEAALGPLHIWVNSIGSKPDTRARAIVDIGSEDFDAQVRISLKSVWAGARAAAPRLQDGGTIVNVSSLAGRMRPFPGHGLYAALKLGVNSLTATLASELAPRLRVNAVSPGSVMNESFLGARGLTREQADEALPSIGVTLGRYGEPEDIGAAVVFLTSPAAAWITGQTLEVTGGA